MITLDVHSDIDRLVRALSDVERKQIPFATAAALTATAKLAQAEVRRKMTAVFDEPTRFTLNSTFITPATKRNPEAQVYFKDQIEAGKGVPAGKYLAAQLEGGTRAPKRFEKALIAAGAMPRGYFAVPGESLILDANGNVPRNLIVKILADLRAFGEVGYKSNRLSRAEVGAKNDARGKGRKTKFRQSRYFVLLPNRLNGTAPAGIYHKTADRGAQPVLIFVRRATYGKALDFPGIVNRVVADEFEREFARRLSAALGTALRR